MGAIRETRTKTRGEPRSHSPAPCLALSCSGPQCFICKTGTVPCRGWPKTGYSHPQGPSTLPRGLTGESL